MMLLGFAALGILAGLLSGGMLRGLARYALNGVWIPLLAYLLKGGASLLLAPQTGAVAVCLAQYSLLFLFILLNVRRPVWPLLAFAGSMMNFLVIVLNGGCMPVNAALLQGTERLALLQAGDIYAYCPISESTRLPMLGDVIRLGLGTSTIGFASIGDVVLCVGVGILFWQMTRAAKRETRTKQISKE